MKPEMFAFFYLKTYCLSNTECLGLRLLLNTGLPSARVQLRVEAEMNCEVLKTIFAFRLPPNLSNIHVVTVKLIQLLDG